jgi:hypothetical protein
LSRIDPEVVYEDRNLPDHIGETYHGHEGVTRAAERVYRWRFRDGKVIYFRSLGPEEADEAARLSE